MGQDLGVCIVTPFEAPDWRLVLATIKAGAYGYLHLGRDKARAEAALAAITARTSQPFGVAVSGPLPEVTLPIQVNRVILPFGEDDRTWPADVTRVWRVHDSATAQEAIAAGASDLVISGDDAAGQGGAESTFTLFQEIWPLVADGPVKLFVQGGIGVHSAAAYLALGAAGVHLDSQVSLMPESGLSAEAKASLGRLVGPQTVRCQGFRVLKWPGGPKPASVAEAEQTMQGVDPARNLLPMGQDFALATPYLQRYRHLDRLILAIREAAVGHLRQAQYHSALEPGSVLAEELGVRYPIIQGPMARVSDQPQFLSAVAQAGAMPMLAVGMASADELAASVEAVGAELGEHPWGVGLLGFIAPATFAAQAQQILQLERRPTAAVIAGGRPEQGRLFEQAGIAAFLHMPSVGLLADALKDGAKRFIFEGRESGGHVGPTYSTTLWDLQIDELLKCEALSDLSVVFAGGIHDARSAAFVAIMAASLSATGARVGVIMGTAYLMTEEAVSTGAIT
ncbi:MAG: nitronate monooxygenase, partial [Propionibacteriaceae bacterium]|nr:nitronate monooxygenase [Propionibacteriaceae bacterium]